MRANLEKWQEETGYRSNFIAEKLNITGASWSRLKQGTQNPSIDLMTRFNEAFPDTDVFELFKIVK